jgi:hypothetical protein
MMTYRPPTDHAITTALEGQFGSAAIVSLRRRPYRYATSFPLEELRVGLDHGTEVTLILKDLTWGRLAERSRRSKPAFLFEPRREVETYRRILGPHAIGARCYAAVGAGSSWWLILEKAAGRELWQLGDEASWEAAARWLATMHTSFAGRGREVHAANPYLLTHGRGSFLGWAHRAQVALADSEDARAPELIAALSRYDPVADELAALPETLVHGEFYPSNVLVSRETDDSRVCPVDWEMAGTGPALLDIAALVSGWGEADRVRLIEVYVAEMARHGTPVAPLGETLTAVDRCRLHLAVQWLGWARAWRPPAEHARDWLGEAINLARGLFV